MSQLPPPSSEEGKPQEVGGWFADELNGVAQTEREDGGEQEVVDTKPDVSRNDDEPSDRKAPPRLKKRRVLKKRPPRAPVASMPTAPPETPPSEDKAQWGILGLEFDEEAAVAQKTKEEEEEESHDGEGESGEDEDEEEEYYEEEEYDEEEEEEEEEGPSFLELAEQAANRPSPDANTNSSTSTHQKVSFPLKGRGGPQREMMGGTDGPDPDDRWGALLGRPKVPERFYYSIKIWEQAKDNLRGILSVEKQLETFLLDEVDKTTTMLPAMPKEKRALVHEMCWYYKITSEAVDREPNRSCYLTKTPDSAIPSIRLSDAIRDPYQDPNEIAAKILRDKKEAMNKTIVMDGDHLNEISVHTLLRQFSGKMIVVPHEEKDFTFFLVFPWGKEVGNAYSFLRRLDPQQIANLHFYRFGDSPYGAGSGGGYRPDGKSSSSLSSATTNSSSGAPQQNAKGGKKTWNNLSEDSSKRQQRKDQKRSGNSSLDTRNAFGALRK